jgi:hypothetical protein
LCAQKCIGGLLADQGNTPFDQFVKGTDCQANADNKKIKPVGICDNLISDDDLPGNDGRNKTLCKMTSHEIHH